MAYLRCLFHRISQDPKLSSFHVLASEPRNINIIKNKSCPTVNAFNDTKIPPMGLSNPINDR